MTNRITDKDVLLSAAFKIILEFIIYNNRRGGCHDTSAILFILANELGFSPILKIGEVREPINGQYFDHSWIEIDNKIFDAAICFPLVGGVNCSGPIFNSLEQPNNIISPLEFGYKSDGGLDEPAKNISTLTIGDYEDETNSSIWEIVLAVLSDLNINTTSEELKNKYHSVKRTIATELSSNVFDGFVQHIEDCTDDSTIGKLTQEIAESSLSDSEKIKLFELLKTKLHELTSFDEIKQQNLSTQIESLLKKLQYEVLRNIKINILESVASENKNDNKVKPK